MVGGARVILGGAFTGLGVRLMRKLLASLAAMAMAAFAQPAGAEIRALIVTVSQYTAPIPSLEGPPNDAAALKALLAEQGAKDIVSINDAQATRASIRAALESLGKRARPGDWVIFYYAGHGSQAKSRDPGEEDGMDEFLPLSGFKVSKPDTNQYILDDDRMAGWSTSSRPRSTSCRSPTPATAGP